MELKELDKETLVNLEIILKDMVVESITPSFRGNDAYTLGFINGIEFIRMEVEKAITGGRDDY